jgi:regulatory protein
VDDRKFARYWVEQRETFKPRSIRALRYELYQKGIPREIVEVTLAGIDEEKSAYNAGLAKAKRWAGRSEEQFREDMQRFLNRRGFNYGVIVPVTNQLWQLVNRDDDQG